MSDLNEGRRRHNALAAELVHYGILLQYTAGIAEAHHYLKEHGIPLHVIDRVLSTTGAPHRLQCGIGHVIDRRQRK
jgi:3-hydroxyisobutyrate dehydrogenase-like beta-hydroxyacid dehydrogenase